MFGMGRKPASPTHTQSIAGGVLDAIKDANTAAELGRATQEAQHAKENLSAEKKFSGDLAMVAIFKEREIQELQTELAKLRLELAGAKSALEANTSIANGVANALTQAVDDLSEITKIPANILSARYMDAAIQTVESDIQSNKITGNDFQIQSAFSGDTRSYLDWRLDKSVASWIDHLRDTPKNKPFEGQWEFANERYNPIEASRWVTANISSELSFFNGVHTKSNQASLSMASKMTSVILAWCASDNGHEIDVITSPVFDGFGNDYSLVANVNKLDSYTKNILDQYVEQRDSNKDFSLKKTTENKSSNY